ncbi:MAG: acyltransferase [Ferruginibacter sp.]
MKGVTKTGDKLYFENLDGLRFFCFLAVFLFHSFHTEQAHIKNSSVYQLVKHEIFGNGFLGVNFFFVLSGFLITYLLIQEKKLNGKINVPNFWLRRILRIWPLYFVCVFIGFVVFPLAKQLMGGVSNESANPWYYIFFINNFDYIQKGLPDATGLGVLWSIAIEEQFYLAWPLILSFFPIKKFWIPFSIIIAGSFIYRALNDVPILHEMHTLSCIGDMAIGALGAWLIIEKPAFLKYFNALSRIRIIFIYFLLISILLLRDDILLNNYFIRIFERSFIAVVMLLVILEQCYSKNSFYKMSSFRIPSKLGLATYGLYCLHFIIISAVIGVTAKLGINKNLWQVLFLETGLALFITIIVSWISYKYFETPFLTLKEKFSYIKKH